jgi:murein lipoprotein
MSKSILRTVTVVTMMSTFALVTGCATSAKTQQGPQLSDVDQAAKDAQATANAADSKASQALQTANQANQKADEALSKTQDIEQKLDRMFKKSMQK